MGGKACPSSRASTSIGTEAIGAAERSLGEHHRPSNTAVATQHQHQRTHHSAEQGEGPKRRLVLTTQWCYGLGATAQANNQQCDGGSRMEQPRASVLAQQRRQLGPELLMGTEAARQVQHPIGHDGERLHLRQRLGGRLIGDHHRQG